jgi:hypothetical protein
MLKSKTKIPDLKREDILNYVQKAEEVKVDTKLRAILSSQKGKTKAEVQKQIKAENAIADDKMFLETGFEASHIMFNIKKSGLFKDQEFKAIVLSVPDLMDKRVEQSKANHEKRFPNKADPKAVEAFQEIADLEAAAVEYRRS